MDARAMSVHASKRGRQRAIPPLVLELLVDLGDREHDHRGAEICYFGKRALRRVEKRVGKQIVDRLGHYRAAYAVVADGRVVTVGYREKRILRH